MVIEVMIESGAWAARKEDTSTLSLHVNNVVDDFAKKES